MFARAAIAGAVCLAVTLSGCSLSPTKTSGSAGFTGTKANVATALNLLASDASSTDGADICKNVLAATVRNRLNKIGTCETIINDQLKTADDSTLTIKSIALADKSNATARVQTVHNGDKVVSTVTLVKTGGAWRVASI